MEKIHGFSDILKFSLFDTDIFIHLILLSLAISSIYYNTAMRKLKRITFLFFIFMTTLAFNFQDNPPSNWTQQFLPSLNNQPISDMTFLDSLTGYMVSGDISVGDTNYILKTTNGGDNWTIINRVFRDLSTIQFLNKDTGYVCGGFNVVGGYIAKTKNGGLNWNTLPNSDFANYFYIMSVLNNDTIFLVDRNSFNGGIYCTTNGGVNWTNQLFDRIDIIYFYDKNLGFAGNMGLDKHYRTTNAEENWDSIGYRGFTDIQFINNLTGWIFDDRPDSSYNKRAGIFGIDASPDEYDKWLNEYLDEDRNGWFDLVHYFKLATSISRRSDISFINLVQTHVVNWPGNHLREPTNEEISLMVNLGISYGAKGTIYFYMNGLGKFGGKNYDRGLAELNDLGNYDHPRYINVYGQAKWENLKSLNRVQEKWGPYIMSFDNINRHSYIYRTENNLMRRDSYVEDLVSSFNGIDETVSKRYLQLSVFKDIAGKNYFMVVNRRCSPVMEGREDDSRNVRILFDIKDAAFSNANRWKIIDLYTQGTAAEFDKSSTGNFDLGLFLPGEGKLYKLEPVN